MRLKHFIIKYNYILIGFAISMAGYLYSLINDLDLIESTNDFFVRYEEYELDEIIIWLILFIMFVFFNVINILQKKKINENRKIYLSMIYASNHILRNLLNQIQVMRIEAQRNPNFDKEAIKMFESSIEEAESLITKLSSIDAIREKNIYNSINSDKEMNSLL